MHTDNWTVQSFRQIVCAALVSLAPTLARAEDLWGFTISLPRDMSSVEIVNYSGDGGDVSIPATIDGKPVVAISANAFANISNLTSVTVPAGVTKIGNSAFASNANLVAVYFLGDAPALGTGVFASSTPTIYRQASATGWGTTFGGRPVAGYAVTALSVSPTSRAVDKAAGTFTVAVTNTAGGTMIYTTTVYDAWLRIAGGAAGTNGGTVTVAYDANAGVARTGTLAVSARGATNSPVFVEIAQAGTTGTVTTATVARLTVTPAITNLSCLAQTGRQIRVRGNVSWSVADNRSWIRITSGASGASNGTAIFRVLGNSGAARTGAVVVTGGGLARTCVVVQAAFRPILRLGASVRRFSSEGSARRTVSVRASVPWTATDNRSWISIVSRTSGSGNATLAFRVAPNSGPARAGRIVVAGGGLVRTCIVSQAAFVPVAATGGDFDGDGRADPAAFRTSTLTWHVAGSAGEWPPVSLGKLGMVPVPADYDGDGRTDIAMYDPHYSNWTIRTSASNRLRQIRFGVSGGLPLPADYDGDGRVDWAFFHPKTTRWYFRCTSASNYSAQWGWSGSIPVPADYDGDGATDIATYRASDGSWDILQSSNGRAQRGKWGWAEAVPVPADYDGDGKADIAVFHSAPGDWYVAFSRGGSRTSSFRISAGIPVPADYDGDGAADMALYRPRDGRWYIVPSSTGVLTRKPGGVAGDARPVLQIPVTLESYDLP